MKTAPPTRASVDPADATVIRALLKRDLFGGLRTDAELHELERGAVAKTPAPYALLLCRLLGYDPRIDEQAAEAYWRELLAHRADLAGQLGRPVHLRVAAMDLVSQGRTPGEHEAPVLVGPGILRRVLRALGG